MKKKKHKIRILCDMDDVFVDFLGGFIQCFNYRYNKSFTINDCISWNLGEIFSTKAYGIIKEPGFFINLKPKENNLSALKSLYFHKNIELLIVTASLPSAYAEKVQWLQQYCPWLDIQKSFISTANKGAIWGDYLIDDAIHNLNEFNDIGFGKCILFDMPHNRNENIYKRISSLDEMFDILGLKEIS